MINISELRKEDVGRWVEYRGQAGERERGRLKSWSNCFVYVVYACDGQWNRFQDFTGVATSPQDAFFVKHLKA